MASLTMSKSMEEISKIVFDDLDRLQIDLLENILDEVRQKTPVDSGEAKNGWKISGKDIINDVDHIGYLETGTAHTRPIGMVSTTLVGIDSLVKQVTTP